MGAPGTGRSRLRRALRVSVAVALAFATLVILGLAFLHTWPGRLALRTFLEGWGSGATGGTLRLGQVELALWKGHASATALTLSLPGTAIEAQRVALDWSRSGPRLTLLRPSIVVTESGEPKPAPRPAIGLAAQPWRALERLAAAQVEDGRLELRDAKGTPWLVLGRLDAELAERSLTLRVEEGALGVGDGARLTPVSGEAGLRLDDGVLVVERARLISGTTALELTARLQRILPTTATATARAAFDETLVSALAPGTEAQGRVEAAAAIEVVDDRLTGTLDASSKALTVAGVGPWVVAGRGRLESDRLRLDPLTAEGFGGRVEATGPLALAASADTDVTVRAHGLDPALLVQRLQGKPLPLSARASGALRVTTRGWDVAKARGDGRLELVPGTGAGLKPAASATLRLRGRSLALADARVSTHGASVEGDAELSAAGAVKARFQRRAAALGAAGALCRPRRDARAARDRGPAAGGRRGRGVRDGTAGDGARERRRSRALGKTRRPGGRDALRAGPALGRAARAAFGPRAGDAHRHGPALADGRVGPRGRGRLARHRARAGVRRARRKRAGDRQSERDGTARRAEGPRLPPRRGPPAAAGRGRAARGRRRPRRARGRDRGPARRAAPARGAGRRRQAHRDGSLRCRHGSGGGHPRRGRSRRGAPADPARVGAADHGHARRPARALRDHLGPRGRARAQRRRAAFRRRGAAAALARRALGRTRALGHGQLRHDRSSSPAAAGSRGTGRCGSWSTRRRCRCRRSSPPFPRCSRPARRSPPAAASRSICPCEPRPSCATRARTWRSPAGSRSSSGASPRSRSTEAGTRSRSRASSSKPAARGSARRGARA